MSSTRVQIQYNLAPFTTKNNGYYTASTISIYIMSGIFDSRDYDLKS